MIAVATAKKWNVDRFSKLEQEGYKKFPYYYQIYFSAFDYHSPMWNGNQNDVEKFANMAVAYTAEKDKGGMYARVYWYASQRYYGNKLFTESDVTWQRMSKAIDDVLSQYPDQWNINNFAYFSCLAGDAAKANKLISQVDPEPITTVWKSRDYFDRCKAWSAVAKDR